MFSILYVCKSLKLSLTYLIVLFIFPYFSQETTINLYNKIRTTSISNDLDSAFFYSYKYIETTITFDSLVGFVIDTDLINLRNSLYGKQIDSLLYLKFLGNNQDVSYPKLGYQLWKFGVEDQQTRTLHHFIRNKNYLIEIFDELENLKSEREIIVIENIKKHKHLTNSKVGEMGAKGAFLIIQHSEKVKYLKIYYKSLKNNFTDINPRYYAMAKDRWCIKKGKKQIYGTQGGKMYGKIVDGIFVPTCKAKIAPIRGSQEKINKKRSKIGLPPINEDPIWELINGINEKI